MTTTVLSGARIGGSASATAITITGGRITSIDDRPASGGIDMTGLTIGAGLIDLQVNGAFGEDFTADPSAIWRVGQRLPEHGVTAFLPTIITSPPETVEAAIEALTAEPGDYRGAEPLGLHVEGPMISPRRTGIHDPALLRAPAETPFQAWSRRRGVALVTLAPELPGAEDAVTSLREAGVVVSAGHSAAGYEQASEAFGWGIGLVTHLFNAMEPFDNRSPGLVGATFDDEEVVAGIIVDGIHSHPAAVRMAWKLLGPRRLALVTDAMAAAGLGDGSYQIGSLPVEVSDGRVTDSKGRLAGSTLTLDEAVRNLVAFTGCTPEEAMAAASSVPGGALGLSDRGRVEVGARADLIFFDETLRVAATMLAGEMVWRA